MKSFLIILLLVVYCTDVCKGLSIGLREWESPVYDPVENSTNLQQIYRCHGMDEQECERQRDKLARLKQMVSEATGRPLYRGDEEDVERLENCILLTEGQIDEIIDNFDMLLGNDDNSVNNGQRTRKKRNLIDFARLPNYRWPMPVHWRFDGFHSEEEKAIIRSAFQHWADNTCVVFRELHSQPQPDLNYILVTNANEGCYSYVGYVKLGVPYQQLNLADGCIYRFGTPVHEVGHALGLFHQQMRTDRDKAIKILWDNIVPNYAGQFYSQFNTDPLGLPYNFGSVMQYSSLDGVSANGKDTMVALNPLYQMNMGQRTGLSFYDIQMINKAYCSDTCSGRSLSRQCEHGGYQSPKDCSRCVCPDGFSGQFCNTVAPSLNAQCGGEVNLGPGSTYSLQSPGYDDTGARYRHHQECSWWIKAPEGSRLRLSFDGPFGLYCQYTACYHWVEVKYKSDIGLEGARFCCYERPSAMVTSESNEMMIVFKSNYTVDYPSAMRGFKAVINVEGGTPQVPKPPGNPSGWQCGFESDTDPLCGLVQDQTDQFDWTRQSGPTPSDLTGPTEAAEGRYYLYIEASNPRRSNDEARLTLATPLGQYTGRVCLGFNYHMYGFHVRTLRVLLDGRRVWEKSGEKGNVWLSDRVNMDITPTSTIQFIGIRGDEYSGDIAIDQLKLTTGSC